MKRTPRLALICRIIFLLLFAAVFHPRADQVFRADTTLQSIAVQVTDTNGKYLKGLTQSDFKLLENGKPRKIAFFEAESEPISLAVLVDAGRSMEYGSKLDRAKLLLRPLLRGNNPNDEIFFMPFTDEPGPFERLTAVQRLSPPRIVPPGHHGSAIYDALAATLCHMRNAANIRQAVVVISDGVDEHSRLRLEQLLQLVRSSNPQVFMIGLYNSTERNFFRQQHKTVTILGLRQIDNPMLVFKRLADESGAESFFPSSEQELRKAINRVSALLNAQYTIAYYPQEVDTPRRIQVKVNRPNARVSTRRMVGAQGAEGEVRFTVTGCQVSAKEHPYPWESRIESSVGAAVLYHEKFLDRHSGWPNRHEPLTNAHYLARGGYEISRNFCPSEAAVAGTDTSEFVAESDSVVAAYGPWWNNFRATATVTPDWETRCPNGAAPAVGLLFHVMERGFYGLVLGHVRRDVVSFELVRGTWDSTPFALIPWTPLPLPYRPGREFKLAVEYDRPTIKITIDGRTVGATQDATFPYGLMGFGVFDKGRLDIRDLTVEGVPIPD